MKVDQTFLCTFAILYCAIQSSATKVLLGSDWSSEMSWKNNDAPGKRNVQYGRSSIEEHKPSNHANDIEYKQITTAISKALNNNNMRQYILKSIPTLRYLTQEQLSSLSALISAETKSKPDNQVKFEKVSHTFDNNSALVKRLVYGVSNLIRNSAVRDNRLNFNTIHRKLNSNNQISRRTLRLTPEELRVQEQNIGVEQHVIDPRTINEQLMGNFQFVSTRSSDKTRYKRSAEKLLHKLIRIPPPNATEELLPPENLSVDLKLNTSSFAGPYYESKIGSQDWNNNTALSYEQIEDLAFADLNGTEIELNGNDTDDEELPNPEELVSGPRYRISNKHRLSFVKGEPKRKRMPIWSHQVPITNKKCERFTASMCIKADDYPIEQIMGSIRRHKNAMSALLAEYHDKAAELEYQEQLEEYQFQNKRREDGNVITPGGMCASIVRYARPQKARSASGEWKYIINTGRHTQTLRLEKCSTPQESCSYLSHNYRSRCTQVYNYHRLLSWDKTRGLHVDIFKVPTCCSCQVDGYRETFPPLEGSKHMNFKDYTPVPNNNPYSTINDEIDYEDEDDDDEGPITYQFGNGLKKAKLDNFQHSELLLGSSNIKTKVNPPRLSPTVGSYLSPPSGSYDSKAVTKIVRPSYYTHSKNVHNGRSRTPYKNYIPNESRADLEISGTEQTSKEVKAYSVQEGTRIPHKRTRLYSGSSNNETPYHNSAPIVPSEVVPMNYVPTTEQTAKTPHVILNPSTKGSNSRKEIGNGKRINYNYHPIIDFFESHQKSGKGQQLVRNTATNTVPASSEIITSRDRRIGYGMGGTENSWHPLVGNM